ncbi:MAG: 2-amino-4-hydroxy-6-hydroxymethyldihydropteridine diphosphokinase [Spirochaetia bacterium]|nr:2-amino-4-hydroxy-6-hydroxymethyldihydropteridine diphosphokinase [Spirochaetia bacterium]
MPSDKFVFISAGSNIGERENYLKSAINLIQSIDKINLIKVSDFFETKALDVIDQPDFINLIIKISTQLLPTELLESLQEIEIKIGRQRRYDKGPREIDLDILIYEDYYSSTEKLTLPHHSLFTRPFIKEILFSMSEGNIFNFYSGRFKNENNYSILSK